MGVQGPIKSGPTHPPEGIEVLYVKLPMTKEREAARERFWSSVMEQLSRLPDQSTGEYDRAKPGDTRME